MDLVSASCNPCTAELRIEEGEEAQGANQLCCSGRRVLMGGESRVTMKSAHLPASSPFTLGEGQGLKVLLNLSPALLGWAFLCDGAV